MIQAKEHTINFLNREHIIKDTYTFFFNRPAGFTFISGQYNRWTLPITAKDGKGASRFFTISSSPLEKRYLTFTTKIGKSDYKKALMQLKKNDEIKIFGPMGKFIFDEKNIKPRVFLAGGIGITPFHSMLLFAAAKGSTVPISLFASFSSHEELIFYDKLKSLEEKHPNIKIIYTVTKLEKNQTPWSGEKGKISQDLIKKYIPDVTNVLFSVVGPPSMEEAIVSLLKDMQIIEENILTEAFTGY